MPGNITDLVSRVTDSNTGRPIISTLAAPGKAIAAASINLDASTNWTTSSVVHIAIYETMTVGSVTVKDASTQTDWKGTLSGVAVGNLTLTGGTDRAYTAGAKVEITPTARHQKDMYDWAMAQHTQTGAHGAVTATSVATTGLLSSAGGLTVSAGTVSLPAGAIPTAAHADDSITDAKLASGKIYRRQGGSATDWNSVGTTTYDTSAGDVKIQTGTVFNNASPKTVTFPVAFTNKPAIYAVVTSVNAASCFAIPLGSTISTTGFNCQVYDNAGATNNAQDVTWIAIGI